MPDLVYTEFDDATEVGSVMTATGEMSATGEAPPRQLASRDGFVFNYVEISPDGSKAALTGGPVGEPSGLLVIDLASGEVQVLRSGVDGAVLSPTWSPDSGAIAFGREAPDGSASTFVVSADGSGERSVGDPDDLRVGEDVECLASSRGRLFPYDWSPDGTNILLGRVQFCGEDTLSDLALVRADGTNLRGLVVDEGPASQASFSPDGTEVVFESDAGVEVVTLESGLRREIGRGVVPSWSPTGAEIATAVAPDPARGRSGGIDSHTRVGGARRITTVELQPSRPLFSPDNRFVALVTDPWAAV